MQFQLQAAAGAGTGGGGGADGYLGAHLHLGQTGGTALANLFLACFFFFFFPQSLS